MHVWEEGKGGEDVLAFMNFLKIVLLQIILLHFHDDKVFFKM